MIGSSRVVGEPALEAGEGASRLGLHLRRQLAAASSGEDSGSDVGDKPTMRSHQRAGRGKRLDVVDLDSRRLGKQSRQ